MNPWADLFIWQGLLGCFVGFVGKDAICQKNAWVDWLV